MIKQMPFANYEKTAQDALEWAQFVFPMKPISLNAAYIPLCNKQTGRGTVILSSDAIVYKNKIINMAARQKKIHDFETHRRLFGLWIIINRSTCGADTDNCHKLVQDAFVSAGIIPDDRFAVDTRQLYADFGKCKRMPSTIKFAVLIRWGEEIPSHFQV